MNYIPINDLTLPDLHVYHQLRDNAFTKDNSFVADSPKVIHKILESSIEIKSILATQEYYDEYEALLAAKNIPKLFVAKKETMQEIIGHKLHHNAMMHGIRPAQTPLAELGKHIIMLDQISSAENVGSISRSAAALGMHSFLLPEQGPHPYGRRALRVSMGYISMLNTHLYDDIFLTLRRLRENGYTLFAAEITENSTPLSKMKVPDKWVLLMGHEGNGISQKVLELCDHIVHIEMAEGVKSFNVGVAASIMMHQFKNRT